MKEQTENYKKKNNKYLPSSVWMLSMFHEIEITEMNIVRKYIEVIKKVI